MLQNQNGSGQLLILATSSLKWDQSNDITRLLYPRVEYVELAKRIGATFLNYSLYEKFILGRYLRRLETLLRSDITLALAGLQAAEQDQWVLAMSERVGIFLALLKKVGLLKNRLALRFTAWSDRQHRIFRKLGLLSAIDHIIVESSSLGKMLNNEFKVPQNRIHFIPYSIDHTYFHPTGNGDGSYLFSAGEARGRDYATLAEAMRALPDTRLHIAASGTWFAREKEGGFSTKTPANISIAGGYNIHEMRCLYANASIVIIPLYDVVFSAGATVALEAMAMGKPVIASRSQGIADYVVHEETGLLVEPGNPRALREAIEFLLRHPDEAERLGKNGRQRIIKELNLDIYVDRLVQVSQHILAESKTDIKIPHN